MRRKRKSANPERLSSAVFHILVSLSDQNRHGYAIQQEVAARTGGAVKLGAATLYRSIQKMLEDGLIRETRDRPPPEKDDSRRRYYSLTAHGRQAALSEVERLQSLIDQAHASGLVPGQAQ